MPLLRREQEDVQEARRLSSQSSTSNREGGLRRLATAPRLGPRPGECRAQRPRLEGPGDRGTAGRRDGRWAAAARPPAPTGSGRRCSSKDPDRGHERAVLIECPFRKTPIAFERLVPPERSLTTKEDHHEPPGDFARRRDTGLGPTQVEERLLVFGASTNSRSMNPSRIAGSQSRPSSSTGRCGKRSMKARAKTPTPAADGAPPPGG